MRIRPATPRISRLLSRKPVRTRIGWRAIIFFIVASLVMGALAIELNVRLEKWGRGHPHTHVE